MTDPDARPAVGAARGARGPAADEARLARRLLTLTLRHRDVRLADALLERYARDLACVLGARARLRPAGDGGAPGPDVLTLPVTIAGRTEAHLDLTRATPFAAEERELLREVTRLIDDRLVALSQRLEIDALASITHAFTSATTAPEGVRAGLEHARAHLGARAAVLLSRWDADAEEFVRVGDWPEDEGDAARLREIARACVRSERPTIRGERLVAYRIGRDRPARHAAIFLFPASTPLWGARLTAVAQAGDAVAPHLEALTRRQAHVELLRFQGQPWDRPAHELYERLLEKAIRLVPGADSGSLLIRRDVDGPFVFEASRGFDGVPLLEERLEYEEARGWYGDGGGWSEGRARILRAGDVDLAELSLAASPRLERRGSGVDRIRATLCLPILRDGRVMAVLNLDAQHDPDAFGSDSRAVADLFGPPIADLLQRQRAQEALRRAALTDPLTGLDNRRPFLTALRRELARHARGGASVSVLVTDLSGFKRINDDLGHAAGDEALVRVGRALRGHVRDTDVVARWGGDEFAVLLVDASADRARDAADRLRDAVGRLEVRGRPLVLNVGAATAPDDGSGEEALLHVADARMYEQKRDARKGA